MVLIEAAKTWGVVDALEKRKGTSKIVAPGNDSTEAGKPKERSKKDDGNA